MTGIRLTPGRKIKKPSVNAINASMREIKEKAAFHPFCPVTGNQPTVMDREVFSKLCRGKRDVVYKNYCNQVCKGRRLPSGLTFKTKETLISEDIDMVAPQSKPGTCSLCGENKSVRTVLDKANCATCETIRRGARAIPELTIRALIDEQGLEWWGKRTATAGNNTELVDAMAEVDRLRNLLTVQAGINQELETLRNEMGSVRIVMQEMIEEKAELKRALESAEKERDIFKQQLAEMTMAMNHLGPGEIFEIKPALQMQKSHDTELLDLALDVLAGKINGLDADRLRALR